MDEYGLRLIGNEMEMLHSFSISFLYRNHHNEKIAHCVAYISFLAMSCELVRNAFLGSAVCRSVLCDDSIMEIIVNLCEHSNHTDETLKNIIITKPRRQSCGSFEFNARKLYEIII